VEVAIAAVMVLPVVTGVTPSFSYNVPLIETCASAIPVNKPYPTKKATSTPKNKRGVFCD
jgi:hypothetical protein